MYNAEADGRRSAPKAYVASLEEKIRVLEGVLHAHGIDEQTPMPQPKTERIEPEVPVDSGERLKVGLRLGVPAYRPRSTKRPASCSSAARPRCSATSLSRRTAHQTRWAAPGPLLSAQRSSIPDRASVPSSALRSSMAYCTRRCCGCSSSISIREYGRAQI